jgi:hypothetical protein
MTLRWIRFHRPRNGSDVGLIEVRARKRSHDGKEISAALRTPLRSTNALAAL